MNPSHQYRAEMTMGRILLTTTLALLLALFLAGCNQSMVQDQPSEQLNAHSFAGFYEGKPATSFGTAFPLASAREGVALGDAAWAQGDQDRALFEYIRTMEISPKDEKTLFKIGLIHYQRNNKKLAERAFRMVIDLDRTHAGALELLGVLQLERRSYGDAERLFKLALESDKRSWQALDGLGVIADLNKDYDQAKEHYQAALAIAPSSPMVMNNLGYSYYLAGDWNGAAEWFNRAASQQPEFRQAWQNLGLVYSRLQRYDDALGALQHVMGLAEAYNNLGYFCMLDGRYELAEKYLQAAISESPTYYVAANNNLKRLRQITSGRAEP